MFPFSIVVLCWHSVVCRAQAIHALMQANKDKDAGTASEVSRKTPTTGREATVTMINDESDSEQSNGTKIIKKRSCFEAAFSFQTPLSAMSS